MPNDDVDDPDDRPVRQTTRQRVAAPAVLLILCALLAVLMSGAALAVAFTNPSVFADWYKTQLIDTMPAGIMKEDLTKQFESTRESMLLNSPVNLSYYVIGLLGGLVMLYGSWQLKTVGSYRWAVVAALVAFVPLSGCGCFSFPFGLFAIIRLSAGDVIRGFQEARKGRHGY
jgi:hypothetical protein